ncbi:MAG: SusD/RagB family nutrient-binding outer membrane lipoprotein [Weeksellaceae bacterium]
MKYIKFNTFIILLCITLFQCTEDFDEINTHPNKLEEINAGAPLNPILYNLAKRNFVDNVNDNSQLMQIILKTDNLIDQPYLFELQENIGNGFWNEYYSALINIKEMENKAIEDEKPNYEAIALTLKAYAFAQLTDVFGDIPMEEALKAEEGIIYPKFSEQSVIYEKILEDLKRANELYDVDTPLVYSNDILFNNNVMSWKKFTNSLRLRLLLRISNRKDTYAEMVEIVNNPTDNPVFEHNDESAILEISGVAPSLSPYNRPQDFYNFKQYNAFFIDILKDMDDPRLPFFATEAKNLNNENIGYIGVPIDFINNPLPDSIAAPSGLNREIVESPMIIPILPYSEVEFIKAELAQKGYIGNAEQHYKKGVKAAIEQWNIVVEDDYFNNANVAYDGTLERIITQKYLSSIFTDFQSWSEYRRTGLPELITSSSMANDGIMPARFYYQTDVVFTNPENYKNQIDKMGGDNINVKVWWAK